MAKRRKTRRKKQRSRKQKAATAKLVRFNKSKGRRKPKRRRKSKSRRKTRRKSIKAPKRRKSMVGRGIRSKLSSPLIRKVLMAAGAVSLATTVAAIVLPNQAQFINNPLVKGAIGFAAGDIPGALTAFLVGGGISSLTGGGNGGAQSQASSGFA